MRHTGGRDQVLLQGPRAAAFTTLGLLSSIPAGMSSCSSSDAIDESLSDPAVDTAQGEHALDDLVGQP